MKKYISFFVLCSLLAQAQTLWTSGTESKKVNRGEKVLTPKTYVNVAQSVGPAVVNISITKMLKNSGRMFPFYHSPNQERGPFDDFFGNDFFEKFFGSPKREKNGQDSNDEGLKQQSLGSGFIIHEDGYVVTNHHVIAQADEVKVILSDESEYLAKVIGSDQKTDVALLKMDGKKKFPTVLLGDSDQMVVGDLVVAIGNPFGLSNTTTQGIISAKERSIGQGAYDDFIQTDASINPGNSGGPLLNLNGEVIGINTAIVASGQGIGFAIPINLAKTIITQLKEHGVVKRAWLGVMIQKVNDEHVSALKLPKKQGALVSDVQKDSPAQKAGLNRGDVIVKFDGQDIKDWHQLPMVVASTSIGKTVGLEVIRDGAKKTFKVTVEKLKEQVQAKANLEVQKDKPDNLGLVVDDIDEQTSKNLDQAKGVLVVAVDTKSSAYAKGVREGDVIVELNKKNIQSLKDYQQAAGSIKKGQSVLMLIQRKEGTLYLAFTLN